MLFRFLQTLARFCRFLLISVLGFRFSPLLLLGYVKLQDENKHNSESALASGTDAKQPEAAENVTSSSIDFAVNSVVKVFTVYSMPSVLQPWRNWPQQESGGSGFVISGKKILTNAHVVADHIFLQVRKHGSPTKYKAQVRAIGHECDLAILEIDNEEFWEDMIPLELGEIPSLDESVAVFGYPTGGDSVSITKGYVSRVEYTRYAHGGTTLLAIQTDAAINPGNSGGPAIIGNKMAGVAFQKDPSADNIGYIIPTPVIKHFLTAVEENGQYGGFCTLDISYQLMENSQLRNHFKMGPEMTGILINEINPLSDAYKRLRKDDIILAIDDVLIGNDAKVTFRNKERINFNHFVSMKKLDETVLLQVLRDGKEHEFHIMVKPVPPLVPGHQYDKLPSYYIFAGFVFVPLTQPYIDSTLICNCAIKYMPEKAGEQLVLADDINAGYTDFKNLKVIKVNGVQVENLKHLTELVETCWTEDLRLDLENEKVVVLNYANAKEATSLILELHRIPSANEYDYQWQS
ncbi:F1E22.2 [Arabidopsis thaliana]|uniref:Protease Do-like 4, mitochondrial n=2 Tax=Arabidopsis thaliana TaxID=3702 RepID=DEGP4_ARATH|nr:DegP protease 4 [Arabidopsis thaliana]Q9SHZ0.1 RecName: Full=Protease Do-like 4, mitochondrial; Flags: Precursor [Arabidopsis thaliana]AAF23846.1 F1E22.2 [Arabidopsis thaliana]ANM60216.1 DegP protease 4 [Arabidopsis thaliana]VYS50100.1 unnamed protein product [Arabidopsis thaliana]|eukprot:NP_001322516.1 DegP protease 4 [Arabidopsis thaliana]